MQEDDFRPEAFDLAMEADRLWFAAHPGRRHRIRQALVGEYPGITAEHQVVVRQSLRGLRLRWAFLCNAPLPPGDAPESVAKGVFETIARQYGFLAKLRAIEGPLNALYPERAVTDADRDTHYPLRLPNPIGPADTDMP